MTESRKCSFQHVYTSYVICVGGRTYQVQYYVGGRTYRVHYYVGGRTYEIKSRKFEILL